MISPDRHLHIGGFLFAGVDQLDFTGPFEVLSRLPNATFHAFGRTRAPVRDTRGLILTPDLAWDELPALDVLVIPGGGGVNALMEDAETLSFLRQAATNVTCLFAICTGALLLGAAGLLAGRRATTHWASHEFLGAFGSVPVAERVVFDGHLITTAGVTSGIDGALRAAAFLRGDAAAEAIQLYLQYAPEPPYDSGNPTSARPEILASVRRDLENVTSARRELARRAAGRLSGSDR